MVNGTLDSRINIVFMGDGYILNNMDNFINDVNEVTDALFDEVPYSNYINFFNVYAIEVLSNESGTDHPGNAPDCGNHADDVFFADTYFNSSFDQYNIHRLLVIQNIGEAYDVLADNLPQWDIVFIIVNHTMYGGSGGSFATFSRDSYSTEIAIHELGHTFPGLSDEYWAGFQYAQENVNMTQETNPDIVIWNPWLYDYGIGIYNYENPGNEWFRPHQNCKMKSLGSPFCSVCSEHTILSIYNLIDATEGVQPDNFDLSINLSDIPTVFTLGNIVPEPNSLDLNWYVNDIVVDDQPEFILYSQDFGIGDHEIKLEILDNTSLVRDDPNNLLYSEINWFVEILGILGDINLDAIINILDLVLIVNIVLADEYYIIVDMNGDDQINILDIVIIVNIIIDVEDPTTINQNNNLNPLK